MSHILEQNQEYGYNVIADQLQSKATIRNWNKESSSQEADDLYGQLPAQQQKAVDLAKEKGASTWLTALPLKEHGFSLHKAAFHDAMALRYGWSPSNLPSKCDCGNNFTVEHALSCAKGGFPSIRHNEIRDLTANLLTEVCNEVCIEPNLQPTTSDQLSGATANSQDGARLDISANGVWGGGDLKRPFLMYESSTPTPPPIRTRHLLPATESMKERKNEHTNREYVRWSTHLLLLLFSRPQEEWGERQPVFTNA